MRACVRVRARACVRVRACACVRARARLRVRVRVWCWRLVPNSVVSYLSEELPRFGPACTSCYIDY